ncbi:aldose epimerase family protein [Sinorhizobium arboris]|uniref:aldose epimerase family protein n=1 Tax=Sinorhizobium arboris TaxID=76745 RepID=UPI000415F8C8|nr:aldose epimerase family protein [Sinorhizobium arboris]
MQDRIFGQIQGADIHEVTLRSASGMEAKVLTWGAAVRDLLIPTARGLQRVVVGYNSTDDYAADTAHAGAIAGRFANRITRGRFELDGRFHQLPLNQDNRHTLHGGGDGQGFSRRPWTLETYDSSSVTLSLQTPDGDAGFPGNLDVRCVYRLSDAATLRVELTATTDAPTPCNLASHSYFNLELPVGFANSAVPNAVDHEFMAQADFYTPVDDDLIPTGEVLAVRGTPFDFRRARPLRNPEGVKYDVGLVLRSRPSSVGDLRHAGTLSGPRTGMALDVYTTEPHLQLYDGGSFKGPGVGLDGARYGQHCGICLEPQRYPDSPNRSHFPDATLRPGETYRQVTEYRFRVP